MLDVCLLGTGGMMPLPYRWLTSLMMRYNGDSILIDCGEGTQIAMREKGWSAHSIAVICFTHFHADHMSGLPGMLLSMGNSDRTEPLLIIGPKGIARVVNSLRVIAPELPFEINFMEIEENGQTFEMNGYTLKAYKLNHNVPCYGYTLEVMRAGKFDAQRAKEQNIPLKLWSRLQKGETIEEDGITYTPEMVLGPKRRGLKVAYCTDTRPTASITEAAAGADIFICEGMYGGPDSAEKVREHKHLSFVEAGRMAASADPQPKEMWLTHYSPSLSHPQDYTKEVRAIFANTIVAKDGQSAELRFDDE